MKRFKRAAALLLALSMLAAAGCTDQPEETSSAAESGSSDTGRVPRCLFLILSCPLCAMAVLPKGRFPSGSIGHVCVILWACRSPRS